MLIKWWWYNNMVDFCAFWPFKRFSVVDTIPLYLAARAYVGRRQVPFSDRNKCRSHMFYRCGKKFPGFEEGGANCRGWPGSEGGFCCSDNYISKPPSISLLNYFRFHFFEDWFIIACNVATFVPHIPTDFFILITEGWYITPYIT